jgi:serine/threonine protein phosphatase 1
MRELTIGDIHGCAGAFRALLEIIQPQRSDTLVLLGDYIDRGPDSCGVIEMILELTRQCTVVPLTGNHEIMFRRAQTDADAFVEWQRHGGDAVLDSYQRQGYPRGIEAIPAEHLKFLNEQTVKYWETEERIYVHAAVDPHLDLDEQPDYILFWQRFANPMIHKSGKAIVCGHTSQKSGLPALFNKGVCIDTWCYGGGWLTCFDPAKELFVQCRENGEQRTFDLEKLTGPDNRL